MADDTFFKEKYSEITQIPPPDDLVNGWNTTAAILVSGSGDILRGTLLMKASDGGFVLATQTGIETAGELAVLCNDLIGLEEGVKAKARGYFYAEILSSRIILPYETEADDHAALIEAIRVPLRKHGLMLQ